MAPVLQNLYIYYFYPYKMENSVVKEEKIIEQRKKRILEFIKVKYAWISYVILAIIVFLAVRIRTLNLPRLRDITTGAWTLGPDLDPFLFLRWAKDIVLHGSLMSHDAMRYIPLGFNTKGELILLPYLIAWFHKVASWFTTGLTVEHSAVIYPAFMFGLTVIAFFLLTRKIFLETQGEKKSNIIALIASFFLSVIPTLLPRTIAGIPEKESTGFLFLFLAFYFFLCMWKSKSLKSQVPLAILAGLSTAAMAMVWGGFIYILLTLSVALFIAFLLGQMDKNRLILSWIWIISSYILMNLFSTRYSFSNLITSTTTLMPLLVLFVITIHHAIYDTRLKKYFEIPQFAKIPKPVISLIVSILLVFIIALIAYGPGYIGDKINDIAKPLITPISDRLGVTVAENKQPFFSEWANNFGPMLGSVPVLFWIFFLGSIYLYYHLTNPFTLKERINLTVGYTIFLFAIIFSRYSSDSTLNGTNGQSIFLYVIGVLALLGTFGYYYYKYHKNNEKDKLTSLEFGLILIFSLFFFSIISARGSVRTVMVLAPAASMIAGYFIVASFNSIKGYKDSLRPVLWILFGVLLILSIFAGIQLYQQSTDIAKSEGPSIYTYQWQNAMAWVRENTSTNAVFGHWWDYGYWVQTIGERATVLDGGNAIAYWDYLMGRHALTTPSSQDALEFLYSHNTTHFLIDSTDIGKYGAFSTIGSDENYDRASYITTFLKDSAQTQETKNSTLTVYLGGFPLDSDLIYESNGSKISLPSGKAVIGAIIIERDKSNQISKVEEVVIYNNRQYRIPIRYVYDSKFIDFSSGSESGVFLFPAISQVSGGMTMDKTGALLYLSNRTVKSQLARLYLYNEANPNFKLVHSEPDQIVSSLRSQGALAENEDFVYYPGADLRGPIKIWEINYPSGMQINQTYLQTSYPNPNLQIARQ